MAGAGDDDVVSDQGPIDAPASGDGSPSATDQGAIDEQADGTPPQDARDLDAPGV